MKLVPYELYLLHYLASVYLVKLRGNNNGSISLAADPLIHQSVIGRRSMTDIDQQKYCPQLL